MCYIYKNLEQTLFKRKSLYPYPMILKQYKNQPAPYYNAVVCITTRQVLSNANWNDGIFWSEMIAGMVHKLQGDYYSYRYKCTLTVMNISITNNTKEHKFQFQKSMGKHFPKASLHNLVAELPSEYIRDASCRIYNITAIFLLYVFQILCILLNNTQRSACYIVHTGYPTIITIDVKLQLGL